MNPRDDGRQPFPYASPACEWAALVDARWFERHPDQVKRIRLAISGEFPAGCADGCTHVLVTQLLPGVRAREPLWIYAVEPSTDDLTVAAADN